MFATYEASSLVEIADGDGSDPLTLKGRVENNASVVQENIVGRSLPIKPYIDFVPAGVFDGRQKGHVFDVVSSNGIAK